ncbi:NUDIX hydrolase [Chloroflexota bacterium]
MKFLGEIFRTPGIATSGRTIHRDAVRAVIRRGEELLMIYSPINGDYKFPGGGVEPGESYHQALAREIREECGLNSAQVGAPFGFVIEYDRPAETDYDLFKMTSRYYFCQVGGGMGVQRLDPYESDLGFAPVWVSIGAAIDNNQAILRSVGRKIPRWTKRDTFVLEYLIEEG